MMADFEQMRCFLTWYEVDMHKILYYWVLLPALIFWLAACWGTVLLLQWEFKEIHLHVCIYISILMANLLKQKCLSKTVWYCWILTVFLNFFLKLPFELYFCYIFWHHWIHFYFFDLHDFKYVKYNGFRFPQTIQDYLVNKKKFGCVSS